jgi:HAD superfamily hydrolase (TIGR01450 family)
MSFPRGVVFDIDGCLMRGARALAGAAETVAALRDRGLAVRYFTNDSSKTPAQIATRLEHAGVGAQSGEVLTSALVAAGYAADRFPGGRVLALGGTALEEAFTDRGLHLVREAPADAVIVGRDLAFGYEKLQAACQAIWAGAAFLATNLDRRMPVENGYVAGTGAIVKAVAWATARTPLVTGKPSVWAGRAALRSLGLAAREVVVVGDQLEQDVRMGKAIGARAVLVLTGSSTQEDVSRVPPRQRPDAVLSDVSALTRWLAQPETAQGGDARERLPMPVP